MHGTRWLVAVSVICLCLLACGAGEVASSFADSEASSGNAFQGWVSRLWAQTTQAEFEAGILGGTDTRSSPGDVGLARDSGVFAFQGGTANFWRYGVPSNSWASMTAAPNTVGAGGALAYDGVRYIYALRGGGSRTFWRYDTVGGAWAALANAPANVGTGNTLGGAVVYVGPQWVYALRGTNQQAFWRYNIATNTWATMTNAPAAVGNGGALTYDGGWYIYAFRGNNTRAFWRYDTSAGTWSALANTPTGGTVREGGALACDGAGHVYAFRGRLRPAFWMYDIAGNFWTAMSSAPANVGAGGALAYAGSGYVYGFGGNGSTAFWRYDALNGVWTVMANALGNVSAGGALAFVPASAYVTSATIASRVWDTGTAGDIWDALGWDNATPLNTGITFEVRASDTLFTADADNATLAWIPVGGTSPVGPGLPDGQYQQWRATLATTDVAVTPLLNEVRLHYR
jgi:hypothetical protein